MLPGVSQVAEATIGRIQALVGRDLRESRKGIKRDGKGMKYAEYYWLFFDLPTFVMLGFRATFDTIREGKAVVAGKRFAKMRDQAWMARRSIWIWPMTCAWTQLAEWCYLAERQINDRLPSSDTEPAALFQGHTALRPIADRPARLDTASFLLEALGIEDLRAQFEAVPRDNRTGGVGYRW